jgi:hypothetical protein
LGVQGKGFKEPLVLIRDGKKIELPLQGRQVSGLAYLDFIGSYQLDIGWGCYMQGWKCPPDIHLMNPHGEITTIPISSQILEFIPVQHVKVVKNGLLFESVSTNQHEGYLLLRDGVLHELYRPHSGWFGRRQRNELWGKESISPNGCRVAFLRGVSSAKIFVFDHCVDLK